jgi:thioredoxin-related protein
MTNYHHPARLLILACLLSVSAMVLVPRSAPVAGEAGEAVEGPNGLYVQDWFHESFLDMSEDLAEAAEQGKHLAILWEQRGCPYCREMHAVNLADDEIRGYIQENFVVLQLDMWGSREVTDFDGEALEERAMARKWGVHFTPTIMFFSDDPASVAGKPANDGEVMRMPGYFKPYHFVSMFEYVRGAHYENIGFQKFIQARFDRLKEEGKKPKVW